MSYILEALQRSEEERARTAPPDVNVRHAPPPNAAKTPLRTRILNWIIGIVLAVNAVLLGLWVMKDDSSVPRARLTAPPPETQAPPQQLDQTTAARMAGQDTAARTTQARTRPPASSTSPGASPATPTTAAPSAPSADAGTTPIASVRATPTTPPARTATTEPDRTAVPTPAIEARREDTPRTSAPSTPAPETATTTIADRAPATTPAARPTEPTAEPAVEPAPEPEPVILAVRDLPDDVQRRVPPLDFATHLYAPNPAFREVSINGRRYGEGERVEGMLLSEITPTGVIFEHAGYTFSVSVLEDWDY